MQIGREQLEALVAKLNKELPGLTFGYIGNVERWGDDRSWFIFLPHPGRVGDYKDSVWVGATRQITEEIEAEDLVKYEARVRALYAVRDRS